MRQVFIYCLGVVFCLFSISVQAQEIREVRKGMSLGVKDAFTVDVSSLDSKEMEKLLMNYLKEYKGKKAPKKDRKNKEILVDDADIPALSGNSIDLYATMEDKGDKSTVTFWFDLGGAFLSQEDHPEKMEALSEWLYEFGRQARAKVIELELEEEEDKLKDLNKEYEKLVKEQGKLEDIIKKAEKTIEKAKGDLETNGAEQKNAQNDIGAQQKAVELVKEKLKKVN